MQRARMRRLKLQPLKRARRRRSHQAHVLAKGGLWCRFFKPPLGSPTPASRLRPAHLPAAGHEPAASLLTRSCTSRATSVPAAGLPTPANCLSHAADLLAAHGHTLGDHMLRTQSNPLRGAAGCAGPVIRDSADLERFWCAYRLLCWPKHRQRGLCGPAHVRQHWLRRLLQHPAHETLLARLPQT